MDLPDLLAVARGDRPADLLFKDGTVCNVFTGELEQVDVAVAGGRIAGLGPGYEAKAVFDVKDRILLPGFIDAHVHIESSLVTPPEFARAVVPRGTTTVVADPHEIANVHGIEGIRYMLEASEGLPLSVLIMVSSCVPATSMGTAGATLEARDLETLKGHPRVLGLAEVMNFPGVVHGDPQVLAKLEAFADGVVDGHAPGVTGKALNAYVAGGPASDHECTTPEEAIEKLRRGLFVFLREATNARNLLDLLPALTSRNRRRVALCTDDRQPPDLLEEGGIDAMVRTVVEAGTDPVEAVRMATLNPADYFRLVDRGAIAPGRRADLLVVDDWSSLTISGVFVGGDRVAEEGRALQWERPKAPDAPRPAMNLDWDRVDFRIPAEGETARAIRVIPHQIVTGTELVTPTLKDGEVVADPARDLLKIAVVDRYSGRSRVALGLVLGMGLKEGAMAGTVAHDHHNLIAVGADDVSMMTAAAEVGAMGGGLAVANARRVLARLPLPVGGLMSQEPIEDVRKTFESVVHAARSLGSPLHDPFMAMSFLGLEVIPSLKITDQGLVDVDRFSRVDLWV